MLYASARVVLESWMVGLRKMGGTVYNVEEGIRAIDGGLARLTAHEAAGDDEKTVCDDVLDGMVTAVADRVMHAQAWSTMMQTLMATPSVMELYQEHILQENEDVGQDAAGDLADEERV